MNYYHISQHIMNYLDISRHDPHIFFMIPTSRVWFLIQGPGYPVPQRVSGTDHLHSFEEDHGGSHGENDGEMMENPEHMVNFGLGNPWPWSNDCPGI